MSVLKPLFTVVEALLREHEQLLQLAVQKKAILIKNDLDALNAMVNEEVGHIHRIERLEIERQGAGRLLAVRAGVPLEKLTASLAASLAETPEERERMNGLTEQLRSVIDQLRVANDLNKKLIETSLQFIQSNIEVMTESPLVPTYGGTGQSTGNNPYAQARTSYFDSKA